MDGRRRQGLCVWPFALRATAHSRTKASTGFAHLRTLRLDCQCVSIEFMQGEASQTAVVGGAKRRVQGQSVN